MKGGLKIPYSLLPRVAFAGFRDRFGIVLGWFSDSFGVGPGSFGKCLGMLWACFAHVLTHFCKKNTEINKNDKNNI